MGTSILNSSNILTNNMEKMGIRDGRVIKTNQTLFYFTVLLGKHSANHRTAFSVSANEKPGFMSPYMVISTHTSSHLNSVRV